MLLDVLYASINAGGWVMYPIFFTGVVAFALLADTTLRFGRDLWTGQSPKFLPAVIKAFEQDGSTAALELLRRKKGVVARTLRIPLEHPNLTQESLRELMRERSVALLRGMDRGLHFVGVLGSVAPLLGLLGTVEGMVRTFQIISTFGNSNPSLLAGGISEALIATQSGLLIAFPVMLLRQRLVDRVEDMKIQIELGLQELYLLLHQEDDK